MDGSVETERFEELGRREDDIEQRLDRLETEDSTEPTGFDSGLARDRAGTTATTVGITLLPPPTELTPMLQNETGCTETW